MKTFQQLASRFPRVHFWKEPIDGDVVAIHACRSWDEPANGVFMLFFRSEITPSFAGGRYKRAPVDYAEVLHRRLLRREHAMMNYHGRLWRKYLTDFSAYPGEYEPRRTADAEGFD